MVTWGVADAAADRGPATGTARQGRSGLSTVLAQLDERRECSPESVPRATTNCFSGRTARLRVPGAAPTVAALDCDAQYTLTTASELPEGSYLLSTTVETTEGAGARSPLAAEQGRVHIRFDGPASLRPTDSDTVLSMWDQQRVVVGVGESTSIGPAHVQVRESPAGLATGLSHLSAAHHTLTPSRSHPGQRGHPPLLTTGESTSIPTELANTKPETGIELRSPPCVESLFVVAPLAYYLGADVTVGDRKRVVLTAEGTDVHHEFGQFPDFQNEVAEMLQRQFYLDCLVRRMNPESDPELLDRCSMDPETVRSLSPADRLERYMQAPTAAVDEAVPEWHLSTHTDPSLARARCLPFLLDKLSLICLSDGSELDRRDLLEKTLSDTYTRGAAEPTAMVEPQGGVGRVTGWLAPGTPIDAFKTTPSAYENRYRYRKKETDHLQLSVVLNDMEMSDERHAVSEIYRAADLPMDVTVSDQLTTGALADVFESENDFVHFIGHCEDDGLRCPDGNLSMESLSESRTRTFFLNACGSYEQGLALIEQGSVAGAVTFADVLDSHAAMVGTAFARLLSNGFSIQRALQLARRRIMMSKDYAVVGDGTYALLPGPTDPVVVQVSNGDRGYNLTCEVMTPQGAGESYDLPFDGQMALNGTETELSVSAETLVETLESASLPVIFEGEFHWSEDLAARLDPNF
ncbi:CHAT domain-containing protein [Haloarcula sp. S1CR25-12]|uniref:CHAT domain-containing protein n=1 Tax=Haloarcula saliterrae TaxID=2950534 RepID=A0ABU2F9I3_9EURY|nr:hypothetical protein [Haloarcula sp. S1CR25-12]MDS0258881.1 CHAT domain-containing protein [Haloarcula sp. S1CR25-12]